MLILFHLIVFVIAQFGFCYVVGAAEISQGLREWIGVQVITLHEQGRWRAARALAWLLALVQCPACLGAWVGLGAWALMSVRLLAPVLPTIAVWYLQPLVYVFFTCGVNFMLGLATGLIARHAN